MRTDCGIDYPDNGINFIGVDHVVFPGGIEGINLQTISVNQLSVVVPPGYHGS